MSVDPYTFEHNGVTVCYYPAVVRTQLEKRRIQLKLMEAFGVEVSSDLERSEWDNMSEYASAMSQCKSSAAWWVSSNATPSEIKAAYETFMEQDIELFDKFLRANVATLPPKKTILSTLTT